MQLGVIDTNWMQWIPCIKIQCSGFNEAVWNASRVNEVESMQRDWMQLIPCSVANVSQLNAVYSMQHCAMDPDGMQRIHAMWPKGTWLNAGDPMQHYWMQWILCRVVQCISIEWSGFHAAWCNWYRWNAVDSMQCGWMHWIPCSSVKCIPSECSGLHADWPNGSWLNEVDSMQCGPMDPDWMQWIPCSVIECSGF